MKVAIVGIDGLDPVLFERWRDALPHLDGLARKGLFTELESVIPPDSVPAWISIFTGVSPAEHGALHSFNYLDGVPRDFSVDVGAFRGKTFWDCASSAGRKVLVLNPFLAYPAWPVNGTMVSAPVFEGGETTAHPAEMLHRYRFPPLGGIVDFPRKEELPDFVSRTHSLTERQAETFLRIAKNEPWDLLFLTLLTFDRLAHYTWRYTDAADPTSPGANPLEQTLFDAYRQFDRIVGELAEIVPADGEILVISDHGHGRRCSKVFNVNEFLRNKGYLSSTVGKHPHLSRRYWTEVLKVKVLEFLDRHELQDLAFRIARLLPNRKALKHSTHVTDRATSLAATPDFDGTNPFGGIEISREACRERGLDYEALRGDIAAELLQITDPETGERIVRWARTREEIAGDGPYAEEYPDLVFELDPDYGVSWNLFSPLIGINTTHRKISGGHRRNGVLFSRRLGLRKKGEIPGVLQIAPTVLSQLDISIPDWMKMPPLQPAEIPSAETR